MQLTKRSNTQISEKEYRNLQGELSSSDIRLFIESRKKFYKTVICGEYVERDETVSTLMGNLVDTILTSPEDIDNRYTVSVSADMTGQMAELVECLYKISSRTYKWQEEGQKWVQSREFEEMFNEAVNWVKYQGGVEELKFKKKDTKKILELWCKPDKDGNVGEKLYAEKLAAHGRTVVGMNMMTSAERVAQEMKENEATGPIVNMESNSDKDVYKQMIVRFEYKGIKMRAMMDIVEVNHTGKYIQPNDIKVTYDNDEGFTRMYLKGLYIQAAVYDQALICWAKENGCGEYEVRPMRYPVGDSKQENCPILHSLTYEDIERAYKGFKLVDSHKWYPGLDETIDDIKYHIECANWRCSRNGIENGYKIGLDIQYENQ